MVNQTGSLLVRGLGSGKKPPSGTQTIRVTLVDTDATASTFPDLGGAAVMSTPEDYEILDFIGDGTTAPTTALTFQFNVDGNDRQLRINGANAFDPKSTPAGRIGALLGKVIPAGTNLRIIGRA